MTFGICKIESMLVLANSSSPFQILVSLYFLWKELGPSILAGFFMMICLIPANVIIAAKTRQLQARQMKEKDQRVKMMNEILQGIKVRLCLKLTRFTVLTINAQI